MAPSFYHGARNYQQGFIPSENQFLLPKVPKESIFQEGLQAFTMELGTTVLVSFPYRIRRTPAFQRLKASH